MPAAAALSEAAARAIIAGAGLTTNSSSLGYIRRLAAGIQRQQAAGLPVSRQAARGHRITPEHPNRQRPALPAPASRYPGRKSVTTAPLPAGRSPSTPRTATTPPAPSQRRRRHDRAGEQTRGRRRVAFAGDLRESIVDSYTRESEALRRVREIAASDPDGRVILDGYDCDRPRGGRWSRVFANPGHTPGIGAAALVELAESSGGLQAVAVAYAGQGISGGRGGEVGLAHVCIYNIYYFPSADLRKQSARRRATRTVTRTVMGGKPR